MKIFSTMMGDRQMPSRRGAAIATLLVALGVTASASDAGSPTSAKAPEAKPTPVQSSKGASLVPNRYSILVRTILPG